MSTSFDSGNNCPEYMTVDEISRLLRIGRQKAYELVGREDFPSIRIGRVIRVPRDAFLEWVRDRTESGDMNY